MSLRARLDAKLAELRGRGLEVLWVYASPSDLLRLQVEVGAPGLVPAFATDGAYRYGDVEVRAAPLHGVWIITPDGRGGRDQHEV